MRKIILRNIAIVSAIFIAAFSIMLITNYFQINSFDPLQTEVAETLKEINDENADNERLQEQIRHLDLMARKAYFTQTKQLESGVYILVSMLVVLLVCLRFYFAKDKNIPDKEIDPIDEWMIKTSARKYISIGAVALVAIVLVFVVLSSPYLSSTKTDEASTDLLARAEESEEDDTQDFLPADTAISQVVEVPETLADTIIQATNLVAEATPADTTKVEVEEVPKITHNGFRGNTSNGTSSAQKIPVKWDVGSGDGLAWKVNVPKAGYNSPVINGNKVFVTGADEQARELYCYDLRMGDLLWKLAANNISGSPTQMPTTTPDTGLAASTVATNGKQVCAIFATGDIMCADVDGKRLWAKNLGVPQNHYGYASSLLIFGNSVIVQYDNSTSPRLISLNLSNGSERWSAARKEKITWSSPTLAYIDKKPQLLLMGNPAITSFDPNNGEEIWRLEGFTGEVGASPCSSNGVVFGATEYSSLMAIDGKSGEMLWKVDDFLPEVSSPVATKDNVYIATSYGSLACFDTKTGELKKSQDLGVEFYSSPMIVEGKLYIISISGEVFIYSANSNMNLINKFATGEKTYATPAFTDRRIVVRTNDSLYCVETKE